MMPTASFQLSSCPLCVAGLFLAEVVSARLSRVLVILSISIAARRRYFCSSSLSAKEL